MLHLLPVTVCYINVFWNGQVLRSRSVEQPLSAPWFRLWGGNSGRLRIVGESVSYLNLPEAKTGAHAVTRRLGPFRPVQRLLRHDARQCYPHVLHTCAVHHAPTSATGSGALGKEVSRLRHEPVILPGSVRLMVNLYICPVCGYGMEVSPSDYSICSSCGTEFEPLMTRESYVELRNAWIASGPVWWSTFNAKPEDWNPWEQLRALELNATGGLQTPTYLSYSVMNGNNSTIPPVPAHRQARKAPVAAANTANSSNSWSPGVLGGVAV
jgi:hypothetical protein